MPRHRKSPPSPSIFCLFPLEKKTSFRINRQDLLPFRCLSITATYTRPFFAKFGLLLPLLLLEAFFCFFFVFFGALLDLNLVVVPCRGEEGRFARCFVSFRIKSLSSSSGSFRLLFGFRHQNKSSSSE